jgi:PPOX class probable F420-dependent enzyme
VVHWPKGARELVEAIPVARFATIDGAGEPHVVPICFVVIADRLFSIVDAKPKRRPLLLQRLRNIAANPRAAVVVDRYDADWSKLAWVMLRGIAAVVDDAEEFRTGVAALVDRYPQYAGIPFDLRTNPLIRLRIERVTSWAYVTRSAD